MWFLLPSFWRIKFGWLLLLFRFDLKLKICNHHTCLTLQSLDSNINHHSNPTQTNFEDVNSLYRIIVCFFILFRISLQFVLLLFWLIFYNSTSKWNLRLDKWFHVIIVDVFLLCLLVLSFFLTKNINYLYSFVEVYLFLNKSFELIIHSNP